MGVVVAAAVILYGIEFISLVQLRREAIALKNEEDYNL